MKTLTMFAAVLLAAGPVFAQPAATPPKQANAATLDARMDQRITQMHQRLGITPAQESAWSGFAQVMRDNVTSTDDAYKKRAASISAMSAPDNMREFAQIEQARAQGVQKLADSFQTLYDSMTDDQKKTADTMFRRYQDRAPGRKHAPRS